MPSARSRAKTPRLFQKQITHNCKETVGAARVLLARLTLGKISGGETEKTHAQIDVRLACDVREKKGRKIQLECGC